LLDLQTLKKYDAQRMYQVYDKWPEMAKESYELNLDEIGYIGMDHVIFAGMGGSGAIGDIFSAILSKTNLHVSIVKGYHLPKNVNSNTLVVATSISGNTIETLSVLDSAVKTNCKVIAFSSGGKLENYCYKNNVEFRRIPQIHSPRSSFTAFLYSMIKVLYPVILIKEEEVKESLRLLRECRDKIFSSNLNEENPSLKLAEWITGIPLIYYPWGLQAAAIRFKNSLQENAKKHSIAEDVIEACHNGIVAWEKISEVQPILIRGKDDYIKTKERWGIIKKIFEEKKIDYREVPSVNGSILSKLINLIYLLDYTTIYRAVLSKIDPSPIRSIDFIKENLSN